MTQRTPTTQEEGKKKKKKRSETGSSGTCKTLYKEDVSSLSLRLYIGEWKNVHLGCLTRMEVIVRRVSEFPASTEQR